MSLASKIFLGTSLVAAGSVVYGVHYLQKREQDTMYQGVIKDEMRTRNKATAAAAARLQTAAEGATVIPSVSQSIAPLNTPGASIQKSYDPSTSSTPSSSKTAPWTYPSAQASRSFSTPAPVSPSAPLRRFDEDDHSISSRRFDKDDHSIGPLQRFDEQDDHHLMGVGVAQPPPLVDEDCVTCVVSPPPQLSEAQSKNQRRREREERLAEYEAQKRLAGRLEQEQGVNDPQARLV